MESDLRRVAVLRGNWISTHRLSVKKKETVHIICHNANLDSSEKSSASNDLYHRGAAVW